MANTITNLIPIIYEAMDTVVRELIGFIPAVSMNPSAERAALNQTITTFVSPAATSANITPGVTPPDDGDQTFATQTMTISKSKRVPVRWNGEQALSLDAPGGPGRMRMQRDQFAQAFRTLANEVEADIFAAAAVAASRATGTAATTPFAFSASKSGFDDIAKVRQILVDNGSPLSDLHLVLGTTAGASLRSLAQLNNWQASQDTTFLRQGILLPIHGMDIRESAAVALHSPIGTGTSYTSTTAGFAVGTTSIPLITGSGTILAGDIITFAGDANQYVVTTGVAAPGTLVIAAPGLKKALAASAVALSIVAISTPNVAFYRNAISLATRLPARPEEGDLATDHITVTDDRSGLSFEIARYPQYRQMQYEISLAWGVKAVKPEMIAFLLG